VTGATGGIGLGMARGGSPRREARVVIAATQCRDKSAAAASRISRAAAVQGPTAVTTDVGRDERSLGRPAPSDATPAAGAAGWGHPRQQTPASTSGSRCRSSRSRVGNRVLDTNLTVGRFLDARRPPMSGVQGGRWRARSSTSASLMFAVFGAAFPRRPPYGSSKGGIVPADPCRWRSAVAQRQQSQVNGQSCAGGSTPSSRQKRPARRCRGVERLRRLRPHPQAARWGGDRRHARVACLPGRAGLPTFRPPVTRGRSPVGRGFSGPGLESPTRSVVFLVWWRHPP
jgi:hypothetical protein